MHRRRKNVVLKVVFDCNYVGSRDAEVFCECAVTVNTNAACLFAPLTVTCTAVIALTANDMAFTGNALTNLEAFYAFTESSDFANVFVANCERWVEVLFGPFVPFIDVNVCAADSCLLDLDKNFASLWCWNRNLHKCEALNWTSLNESIHHCRNHNYILLS